MFKESLLAQEVGRWKLDNPSRSLIWEFLFKTKSSTLARFIIACPKSILFCDAPGWNYSVKGSWKNILRARHFLVLWRLLICLALVLVKIFFWGLHFLVNTDNSLLILLKRCLLYFFMNVTNFINSFQSDRFWEIFQVLVPLLFDPSWEKYSIFFERLVLISLIFFSWLLNLNYNEFKA